MKLYELFDNKQTSVRRSGWLEGLYAAPQNIGEWAYPLRLYHDDWSKLLPFQDRNYVPTFGDLTANDWERYISWVERECTPPGNPPNCLNPFHEEDGDKCGCMKQ